MYEIRKDGGVIALTAENKTLKQQVAVILINECGLPELVPTEYGGTAEGE